MQVEALGAQPQEEIGYICALHFFPQKLFPTKAHEVSGAEGRNSAQVQSGQDESCHPGRQDNITPHHTEIISMAGASKAIRLPNQLAFQKLLAVHANACSLVPKLGEVKLLINSFSVDKFCITETWLISDVTDAEVSLDLNVTKNNTVSLELVALLKSTNQRIKVKKVHRAHLFTYTTVNIANQFLSLSDS